MPRGFPLQDEGPGMKQMFGDLAVDQEIERHRAAVAKAFQIPEHLLRGRQYFCSDCGEGRSCVRPDGRCPMCGGARIVNLDS